MGIQALAFVNNGHHDFSGLIAKTDTLYQAKGKTNPEPEIQYWSTQLALAKKNNHPVRMIRCNNMLGQGYFHAGNYEKAVQYCFDALNIALDVETGKPIGLPNGQRRLFIQYHADSKYLMADLYLKLDETSKAEEYLSSALKLYQSIDFKEGIGKTINRLGVSYAAENKITQAIDNFNYLIKFYEDDGDTIHMANSYNNLGMCYSNLQQWEKAESFYEIALKLYQLTGNKEFEATAWFNLATVNRNFQNKEMILQLYQKSKECCLEAGFTTGLVRVYIDIAQYYFENGELELSLHHLQLASLYANSIDAKDFQMKIHNCFCDVYTAKGNYQEALSSHKKYVDLYQSRFLTGKDKLSEMRLWYEIEKREKENELLQVRNRFQEYVLQTQINRRNYLILFSLLLIVLLAILIGRYRFRVRTNKVLNEQKNHLEEANLTKDKFISIIAHDLRNPIMASQSLTDALIENHDKLADNQKRQLLASLQKATHHLQDLLENLLMWALSQSDRIHFFPECQQLKLVAEKAIKQLLYQALNKELIIRNNIPEQTMVSADINMLLFILRNLISNAIKFSENKTTITLSASETSDEIRVMVEDKGCGMSQEDLGKLFNLNETKNIGAGKNKGTGLGLALCKDFVRRHGGDISVISEPGQGTTIRFTLKKCVHE